MAEPRGAFLPKVLTLPAVSPQAEHPHDFRQSLPPQDSPSRTGVP